MLGLEFPDSDVFTRSIALDLTNRPKKTYAAISNQQNRKGIE
jgi:hypothetical protein